MQQQILWSQLGAPQVRGTGGESLFVGVCGLQWFERLFGRHGTDESDSELTCDLVLMHTTK